MPTKSSPDQSAASTPHVHQNVIAKFLFPLAHRHPFVSLFLIVFALNAFGSIFNISYNMGLIVHRHMDEAQQEVFKDVALPIYNFVAYASGVGILVWMLLPVMRCRPLLLRNQNVPADLLQSARRRLINLPTYLLFFNLLLALPAMVFFPAMVCALGGTNAALRIWAQFGVSCLVSGLMTAAPTYFVIEWFLTTVLYPDFFRDARPAEIDGTIKLPFAGRLILLWLAVACMPMLGLLVVAQNPVLEERLHSDIDLLQSIGWIVGAMGIVASAFISWLVGRDLLHWLRRFGQVTKNIRDEHFSVRIGEKRPDEWGRLNDSFNDMASGLETGRHVYETFGQFVGLDARGEILEMLSGLGGEVRDITVMFLDIRGFTRRSAGARPERIVELLNEFLSLAVAAIEAGGGMVNKFLGDGLMALFGGPPDWPTNHADLAVHASVDLLQRLEHFNERLQLRGEAPLKVGIGIHTGPALVGCIGATMHLPDGRIRTRKEFTVIGETVNLCQRIEQLTKTCGGPILISGQTRHGLQANHNLIDHGMQELERSNDRLHIYEVKINP